MYKNSGTLVISELFVCLSIYLGHMFLVGVFFSLKVGLYVILIVCLHVDTPFSLLKRLNIGGRHLQIDLVYFDCWLFCLGLCLFCRTTLMKAHNIKNKIKFKRTTAVF